MRLDTHNGVAASVCEIPAWQLAFSRNQKIGSYLAASGFSYIICQAKACTAASPALSSCKYLLAMTVGEGLSKKRRSLQCGQPVPWPLTVGFGGGGGWRREAAQLVMAGGNHWPAWRPLRQ